MARWSGLPRRVFPCRAAKVQLRRAGTPGLDREGMQPAREFIGQKRIDSAMAGNARKAIQPARGDTDAKMRLSALAPAAMAAMILAFIDHLQSNRIEHLKG